MEIRRDDGDLGEVGVGGEDQLREVGYSCLLSDLGDGGWKEVGVGRVRVVLLREGGRVRGEDEVGRVYGYEDGEDGG